MNKTYNRILNLVTEMDVKKSLGKLAIRQPLTPAQQKNRDAVNADVARADRLKADLKAKKAAK